MSCPLASDVPLVVYSPLDVLHLFPMPNPAATCTPAVVASNSYRQLLDVCTQRTIRPELCPAPSDWLQYDENQTTSETSTDLVRVGDMDAALDALYAFTSQTLRGYQAQLGEIGLHSDAVEQIRAIQTRIRSLENDLSTLTTMVMQSSDIATAIRNLKYPAPTIVGCVSDHNAVAVQWNVPRSNYGEVSGVIITAKLVPTEGVTEASSPLPQTTVLASGTAVGGATCVTWFTGLRDGNTYTFSVQCMYTGSDITSEASTPSAPILVIAPVPVIGTIVPGIIHNSVHLNITPPTQTLVNVQPLSYVVLAYENGTQAIQPFTSLTPSQPNGSLLGLDTTATSYTFQVASLYADDALSPFSPLVETAWAPLPQ